MYLFCSLAHFSSLEETNLLDAPARIFNLNRKFIVVLVHLAESTAKNESSEIFIISVHSINIYWEEVWEYKAQTSRLVERKNGPGVQVLRAAGAKAASCLLSHSLITGSSNPVSLSECLGASSSVHLLVCLSAFCLLSGRI